MTTIGVVVLTMGTRPDELHRGLESLLQQRGVDLDILCVGNGCEPSNLPPGVRSLTLNENLGVCTGRNAGVPHVVGDLLFFLDDDAWLGDPTFLSRGAQAFEKWPELGIIQPRVHDPYSESDARRWIPRIRKGEADRPSAAFTLWEGAILVRRSMFEEIGGFADEFFFYHEGIELAWRCWDSGHVVWYGANLEAYHPNTPAMRHSDGAFYGLMARNRVWLARRNLPAPLVPLYVASWTVLHVARERRDRAALTPWFDGWKQGWCEDPGPRRPMKWSTIVRMALRGRPPII